MRDALCVRGDRTNWCTPAGCARHGAMGVETRKVSLHRNKGCYRRSRRHSRYQRYLWHRGSVSSQSPESPKQLQSGSQVLVLVRHPSTHDYAFLGHLQWPLLTYLEGRLVGVTSGWVVRVEHKWGTSSLTGTEGASSPVWVSVVRTPGVQSPSAPSRNKETGSRKDSRAAPHNYDRSTRKQKETRV